MIRSKKYGLLCGCRPHDSKGIEIYEINDDWFDPYSELRRKQLNDPRNACWLK